MLFSLFVLWKGLCFFHVHIHTFCVFLFGKGSVFFADTLTFSIFFFFTMFIFFENFFVLKTSILALSVFRLFHLDCDSFYVVFFKAFICFFHNILWLFLYIEKKRKIFSFHNAETFLFIVEPISAFLIFFFFFNSLSKRFRVNIRSINAN